MVEIELRNISVFYEDFQALRDINLELKGGQIHGLLGPNGAGKTTLIRLITGIQQPNKGSIRINGEHIDPRKFGGIGYIPEERGLNPNRTAEENLSYFGRLRGMDKRDVNEQIELLFEDFNFHEFAKNKVGELSKGNSQKVQFMSALVHNPDFLILDEPFNGFDPLNLELFFNRLVKLKEEGKCILVCTHNMSAVAELCDSITFIKSGSLIKTMALKDEEVEGTIEMKFKGNMIGFTNALWTGYELVNKVSHSQNVHEVTLKYRYDNSINDLFKAVSNEVEVISFQPKAVDLKELFIQLTTTQDEEN